LQAAGACQREYGHAIHLTSNSSMKQGGASRGKGPEFDSGLKTTLPSDPSWDTPSPRRHWPDPLRNTKMTLPTQSCSAEVIIPPGDYLLSKPGQVSRPPQEGRMQAVPGGPVARALSRPGVTNLRFCRGRCGTELAADEILVSPDDRLYPWSPAALC